MKKRYECGHKGNGKYCHLCKQIEKGELVQVGSKYYKPGKEGRGY